MAKLLVQRYAKIVACKYLPAVGLEVLQKNAAVRGDSCGRRQCNPMQLEDELEAELNLPFGG